MENPSYLEREKNLDFEKSKENEKGLVEHMNACLMLRLEELLKQEIEFSDENIVKHDPKCKERIRQIEDCAQELYMSGNTEKDMVIKEALKKGANKYINEKIFAKRTELETISELGENTSPESLGKHFFFLRTGTYPQGNVSAYREDGYFVVHCSAKEDQLRFRCGKEAVKEEYTESAGSFHQAFDLSPNLRVKCLLIGEMEDPQTKIHERQHWLNNIVYDSFHNFELSEQNSKHNQRLNLEKFFEGTDEGRKKGRKIKDEIIAYMRDGADSKTITNFYTSKLYTHLTEDFSEEEREELSDLMEEIEEKLLFLCQMFTLSRERAVLVYQLMSSSLLNFPETLDRIKNFYKKRWDEFTDFLPSDPEQLKSSISTAQFEIIQGLYLEIEGLIYNSSSLVMAVDFSENEAKKRRELIKLELKQKRTEYDDRVKKARSLN